MLFFQHSELIKFMNDIEILTVSNEQKKVPWLLFKTKDHRIRQSFSFLLLGCNWTQKKQLNELI